MIQVDDMATYMVMVDLKDLKEVILRFERSESEASVIVEAARSNGAACRLFKRAGRVTWKEVMER